MKNLNLSNVVEVKDYKNLTPGGYICNITNVEDVEAKEYLKIEFDIASGEFKDYYKELNDNRGFWAGRFIKSYKDTALSFFKQFVTCVEKSNAGYSFDNNEKTLMGKFVGIVLASEEYEANDGTVKTRLYVDQIRSTDDIKSKNYQEPRNKKLTKKPVSNGEMNFISASDEELPFN